MNLDLKAAYERSLELAKDRVPISVGTLRELSALVMKNTGGKFSTLLGDFDASKGDLRLVNVSSGAGGSSYMDFRKVPGSLEKFRAETNARLEELSKANDVVGKYYASFDVHFGLVTIHPWVDGNGRMARLIMNLLQFRFGLLPSKVESENKAEYIQALVASREARNPEPFRGSCSPSTSKTSAKKSKPQKNRSSKSQPAGMKRFCRPSKKLVFDGSKVGFQGG